MLEPAQEHDFEIREAMKLRAYSEDLFFTSGQTGFTMFDFEPSPNVFQFASVDTIKLNGEDVKVVIGYLDYEVNFATKSVERMLMISFMKGNITFIKDVYKIFQDLMNTYDRIEFSMVGGNPVERHYDKLCRMYGGSKLIRHNKVIDNKCQIHDEVIYEFITKQSTKTVRA